MRKSLVKRYIDADKLKEDIIVSGLFDSGELGVILHIVEEQPILEVPTPHGDLIDKNRIMYELGESTMSRSNREFCIRVLTAKSLTPIIIEAEE